jgi:peroxiredoxin Q/BCP
MLRAGTLAPDFETVLDDGTPFRLSSMRGEKNVVLYFYPADFTGGCTKEACSFRDSYDQVQRYDAVILGVSRDSRERHIEFREAHGLKFPLISDPDGTIAALYDVKSMVPLLRPRVTYVIDKQGVVRAAFRHDLAIDRHLEDTLQALDQIESAESRT